MLILYTITPLLGFLRNYVKYKQCNLSMFFRTPLTYFFLHLFQLLLRQRNIILKTLILERWFFFIYKTLKSLINKDYYTNKEKYIKKYGLVYN